MRFRPWFEFIKSEANWSDGASRDLLGDTFAAEHGFELVMGRFSKDLWVRSLPEVWRGSRLNAPES